MTYSKLSEWMKAKGLNDAALAAKIEGLSRSQVSRIRRAVSIPTRETAAKLEAETKIPAARFLMGLAGDPDDTRKRRQAQDEAAA